MVQFNIHLKYLDCQCHSDILTSSIKVLVDNLHLEPPQLSQCMVPLRLHDSSWQLNICATASSWRTYKMSVWHPNSCTLGTLLVPVWHLNSGAMSSWHRETVWCRSQSVSMGCRVKERSEHGPQKQISIESVWSTWYVVDSKWNSQDWTNHVMKSSVARIYVSAEYLKFEETFSIFDLTPCGQ